MTNACACVIIVKIVRNTEMSFRKLTVKLKSAEYRKETANIVLGGARFSVFSVFQTTSELSKEG